MTIPFIQTMTALRHERWQGPPPAAAGEWAVTGAFRFAHRDPATLMGRERRLFQATWYGLESFAPALRVVVVPATLDVLEQVLRRLAAHLMEHWSVPSPQAAIEAAAEEIEFARSLADHPAGTVLALEREFNEQGLIERARVVASPADRR
ncbi:MAG: hypothetical protein JNK67_03410 [Alphaproteobacteria bacterium]|nr:hypothetical protein [Alphaproteobacteria bacterium]